MSCELLKTATAVFLAVLTSTSAIASESFGLYVGAGAGAASIINPNQSEKRNLGWTAVAGVRPLPNLGIELQHIDFGHAKFQFDDFGFPSADARAESTALFGMGMLPLPVRSLDLFAKVGVGALQQTSTSHACTLLGCWSTRDSTTSARFGWGLGAQFKWSSLAVRTEFVQFRTGNQDNPELVSLSLLWRF